MATTTAKQDAAHPISYYWNQVKDMDNSQKLELVTYSPEEAYEMTMKDIKAIYDHKDAV